jgi:nicotinate dehydrogenase subunit B
MLLSRRDALKALGGGIIVFVFAPSTAEAEILPNEYLRIDTAGLITLYTHKTELGQGIATALAQIAAEELDVPLGSMRFVAGDTALCKFNTSLETVGSLTVSEFGPALRGAAARARVLLIRIASEQLGLPEARLFTRDGFVIDRENESVRISYATLAGSGTGNRTIPAAPPKLPANWTICGQPAIRLDAIEKVTGKARYAGDITLPGMLYARIVRPPVHGAMFTVPPDTTAAEQIPGVQVVRVGTTLVAVLHAQPDIAERAWALVVPQVNPPANGPSDQTIHDYILAHPPSQSSLFPTWSGGNLTLGQSQAVLTREQTYYTPFLAHAPMEPHAAVASYASGKVKVWASTQAPFETQSAVAAVLVISTANVQVITPFVGGAFGGKAYNNKQAVEAAQLSKATGVPVNVTWTRKEEFFYDSFQPPCLVKIRAGLNASQQICFWDSQAYYTGNYHMATNGKYSIPNHRTLFYGDWVNTDNAFRSPLPFPEGPWRSPGNSMLTFARESHVDALAAAAGLDPVEFRLRHFTDARARNVLTRAAETFGWLPSKTPSGRGCGVACGEYNGVYVTVMAELAVDIATGAITVHRMLSALDCGRVINPDGVRQQMEGGLIMGLGYSLSEELHFQAPAITDLNFDTYQIPRFSWMPSLETVIVPNTTDAPMGCGEPPVAPVGGALANAFFDATGLRANRLPMTRERVLTMLQAAPPPDLNPPEYSANQVRLSWIRRPGLRLQKATSLTNPVWEDIPLAEGQSSISLPATEPSAFFRLMKL